MVVRSGELVLGYEWMMWVGEGTLGWVVCWLWCAVAGGGRLRESG